MRDILVAATISSVGKVKGRVRLQKLVYLLQRMGFGMGFTDFRLHLFGPFSADLADTLDVITRGIIRETGPAQSTYELADPELAPLLSEALDAWFGKSEAEELARIARELRNVRTDLLELTATAVYLRDEAGVDEERLWEAVQDRKPRLASQVERARELMRAWDSAGRLRRPVA